MEKITIALAGNPNCGKTTLFNTFTGAKQRVGNWPGVTVERKEGSFSHENSHVDVIDLPGIYSFSAYSLDEKVSREYILKEKPDVVVNVIDAVNLERNLYLTTQLLEMNVPMVIALNMMDVAKQKRIVIEVEHLEKHLGCPVVPIVASKKKGVDQLKDKIFEIARTKQTSKTKVYYDSYLETFIDELSSKVNDIATANSVQARWLSVKLLEEDEIAQNIASDIFQKDVESISSRIEKHTGETPDLVIADGRYGFIHGLVRDVVRRDNMVRKNVSDAIDKVVLNRLLGIPIFLAVMYFVFLLTINVGSPFIDFFDKFFNTILVDGFSELLKSFNSPSWLILILAQGIGSGLATVSTFIPPIFFIFLSLSFLEDSGYMARAAFVMDKYMRVIGLPGKAFIPMLVGFGCTVPAIMATRTLENKNDRLLTVLISPFMSCGARLPVFALFATLFFQNNGGAVIFSLYVVGILMAVITGLILKRTVLKGSTSVFVMELPPYHLPTFNGVLLHTWNRLKGFIVRAGQAILVVVIVLSILQNIGSDGSIGKNDLESSILSSIGKTITPAFQPMGIEKDNWPATVGLFSGIFAKEAIVGTFDALYAEEEIKSEDDFIFWESIAEAFKMIPEGFRGFIASIKDPLGVFSATESEPESSAGSSKIMERFRSKINAYAYLLFVLIYAPCLAAIATIYQETNFKWAVFSVIYTTGLAWIVSTLFYQISMFYVNPAKSTTWITISVAIFIIFYHSMKFISKRK